MADEYWQAYPFDSYNEDQHVISCQIMSSGIFVAMVKIPKIYTRANF